MLSFCSGIDIYIERERYYKEVYFLESALNNVLLLQCNMGVGEAQKKRVFLLVAYLLR